MRGGLRSLRTSSLAYRHIDENSANMKWKKFPYKALCEKMEVRTCRSPGCGVCSDQANCFGPEVIGARPM